MANLSVAVTTEGKITLSAATAKTILQIVAPTNQRLRLKSFTLSAFGVTSSDVPIAVELVKQTTAGTMSAATPVREGDPGSEVIQTTAQKAATVEPTTTDVLRRYGFHPQGGGIDRSFGFGEEIYIPGGGRLGLRCTAPVGVDVTGAISIEE
jgi:hypothetical protein